MSSHGLAHAAPNAGSMLMEYKKEDVSIEAPTEDMLSLMKKTRRLKPPKMPSREYRAYWRVVDGAVRVPLVTAVVKKLSVAT